MLYEDLRHQPEAILKCRFETSTILCEELNAACCYVLSSRAPLLPAMLSPLLLTSQCGVVIVNFTYGYLARNMTRQWCVNAEAFIVGVSVDAVAGITFTT